MTIASTGPGPTDDTVCTTIERQSAGCRSHDLPAINLIESRCLYVRSPEICPSDAVGAAASGQDQAARRGEIARGNIQTFAE